MLLLLPSLGGKTISDIIFQTNLMLCCVREKFRKTLLGIKSFFFLSKIKYIITYSFTYKKKEKKFVSTFLNIKKPRDSPATVGYTMQYKRNVDIFFFIST